jgi:nucleoside-diphosphate kinase
MEQTLIVFKPDAVQRGVVGEILTRFEKAGLKIVGMKMLNPDRDHYYHHYETIGTMVSRHGEKVFEDTLKLMSLGPVIAAVLEGIDAVALVRKMVGATEPKSAAPGTIRGDYAHMSYGHADTEGIGVPNLIHASGDQKEAKHEINHWFSPQELYHYEAAHERFTARRKHH